MSEKKKDYKIIFDKLAEAQKESKFKGDDLAPVVTQEEADEIEELRRFALELQEEELQSFTTT